VGGKVEELWNKGYVIFDATLCLTSLPFLLLRLSSNKIGQQKIRVKYRLQGFLYCCTLCMKSISQLPNDLMGILPHP